MIVINLIIYVWWMLICFTLGMLQLLHTLVLMCSIWIKRVILWLINYFVLLSYFIQSFIVICVWYILIRNLCFVCILFIYFKLISYGLFIRSRWWIVVNNWSFRLICHGMHLIFINSKCRLCSRRGMILWVIIHMCLFTW